MADIFTPSGRIVAQPQQPSSEPRKATIVYLHQFARSYSSFFGGFNLN